jgi:hypothetical protein
VKVNNYTNFATLDKFKSFEFFCEDFDKEPSFRYPNRCSEGCKDFEKMIWTPRLYGPVITVRICAGRMEFVRSLSREWFARAIATEMGWTEEDIRAAVDMNWNIRVHNARTLARVAEQKAKQQVAESRHGLADTSKVAVNMSLDDLDALFK